MISSETCPFCHHDSHASKQCKDSIDKLANINNRCECGIPWPMDELQALKNLEEYSRYTKECREKLQGINRDLVSAEQQLIDAQVEEINALHVLDKVRELINQEKTND